MPGRREEKKIQTREAILREAAALIEQQGYAGTSMEKVAQAAGIAVGTTYNYFPNKASLLSAITETRLAGLDAALAAIDSQPSPGLRVAAVLSTALRYLATHPKRLWAEAWSASMASRDGSLDFYDAIETRVLPHLDAAFDGRTGSMDPAAASEIATSIFLRYVHLWITDPQATDNDLATDLSSDARTLTDKLTST